MAAKVEITVNGATYGGWKNVTVRRSLKSLSGSFSLSLTERWQGRSTPWPILAGDQCRVLLNGQAVITGFIDNTALSFDDNSRTITVSGRDKTADLVDCSVDLPQSQYNGIRIDDFARLVCAKFGVRVVAGFAPGPTIENVAVQQGETAFEILDRVARKRGLLLTTDGLGALVMTRPGSERARTALILGENLLAGSAALDMTQRFSEYKVKAQGFWATLQETQPDTDFVSLATAKDSSVPRYRPLVIQGESAMSGADAATRAQWEAKIRAARSEQVSVTVQGWTQSDGSLWRPNQIVRVRAPWLGIDGERLISEVSYQLSENGPTVAVISLDRKDAFVPEPVVKPDSGGLAAQLRTDRGLQSARAGG